MALLTSLKYRYFHIVMTIANSRLVSVNHRTVRWVSGTLAKSLCIAGGNGISIFGSTQIGVR